MKRSTLLVFGVVLSAVTCFDDQEPARSVAGPSLSAAAADPSDASATVCVAYNSELAAANAVQAASPDDAALVVQVATLNAIIADACR